jgi:hypothetical protein
MPRSSGTLRYSPKGCSNRVSTKWWLVLDCCEELARYCRFWWNREHRFSGRKLVKPAWASHISVVRDEEPPRPFLWESHEGAVVEFEFSGEIVGEGPYRWLDVRCDRLLEIREELGLPREPACPLHLSVGRVEE